MDKRKLISIRVDIKELYVIKTWRTSKFGRLEVIFRDGVPQRIIRHKEETDLNKLLKLDKKIKDN